MKPEFILKCEWCGEEVDEISAWTGECLDCQKKKVAWCQKMTKCFCCKRNDKKVHYLENILVGLVKPNHDDWTYYKRWICKDCLAKEFKIVI